MRYQNDVTCHANPPKNRFSSVLLIQVCLILFSSKKETKTTSEKFVIKPERKNLTKCNVNQKLKRRFQSKILFHALKPSTHQSLCQY